MDGVKDTLTLGLSSMDKTKNHNVILGEEATARVEWAEYDVRA